MVRLEEFPYFLTTVLRTILNGSPCLTKKKKKKEKKEITINSSLLNNREDVREFSRELKFCGVCD